MSYQIFKPPQLIKTTANPILDNANLTTSSPQSEKAIAIFHYVRGTVKFEITSHFEHLVKCLSLNVDVAIRKLHFPSPFVKLLARRVSSFINMLPPKFNFVGLFDVWTIKIQCNTSEEGTVCIKLTDNVFLKKKLLHAISRQRANSPVSDKLSCLLVSSLPRGEFDQQR